MTRIDTIIVVLFLVLISLVAGLFFTFLQENNAPEPRHPRQYIGMMFGANMVVCGAPLLLAIFALLVPRMYQAMQQQSTRQAIQRNSAIVAILILVVAAAIILFVVTCTVLADNLGAYDRPAKQSTEGNP